MQEPALIHYLPIVTTALSAVFLVVLLRRWWVRRSGPHLLWWAAGILFYGVGTALESAVTLAGNSAGLTKAWYIAGALLGGYPLAQGSVYLLLSRKTAHILTAMTLPLIVLLSILVLLSPVNAAYLEAHRPTGKVLGWQWLRAFTPLINLYAATFLIGGAIVSAWRFARDAATRPRAIGNALIAFGALLPAIGGAMAKGGVVEALYLGELVGLLFIRVGYAFCTAGGLPLSAKTAKSPETLHAVLE
jgi:hypothetical protein